MPIGTLAAIGLGAQGVGAAMNLIGQNRLKNQAKQARRDLTSANNKALSAYDDYYTQLEGQETLNMDRSLYDAIQNAAQNQAIAMQGRATGVEAMRDSVRQSTADAIATNLNVAGSGTDALSAVSQLTGGENKAMNRIDSQAAQQRIGQMNTANGRLMQAMNQKAAFNTKADLLEFQSRQSKANRLAEAQLNRANMERDFTLGVISQDGAIANAGAAMWGTLGQAASSIGGTLGQIDYQNQYMDMMSAMNAPDIPVSYVPPSNVNSATGAGTGVNTGFENTSYGDYVTN